MSRATYGVGTSSGGYLFTPTVATNSEAFTIYWPRVRPAHGAKGVIFLIHGAGGSAKVTGSGGVYEGLANYLTNGLGFTVVAADFGSNGVVGGATTAPNTWANNVAMAALDAAFIWATGGTQRGTSTGTAATTLTDTGQAWLTNAWRGRTVTSNGKTGVVTGNTATALTVASWTGGTPASAQAYTLTPHYADVAPNGKSTKVILLGVSMGGWIARNWASRNTSKVACIVDIAGVIDGALQYAASGSQIDYAYGPAEPTIGTTTGTAGAVAYLYKVVAVSALGDGAPSAASVSFNGPVQAGLGATPNTVNWTQPAAATSAQLITGYKILRSVSGGAYTNIGSVGLVATFLDNVTGAGSAYTPIAANNTSATLGAYGINGLGAATSYDPLAASNLTAGLKAIPLQMWWSANDNGTSTGSGVAGTVNTEVQTFATAYGANLTLQEIPGDPVHNSTISTVGASAASLALLGAFIVANQP